MISGRLQKLELISTAQSTDVAGAAFHLLPARAHLACPHGTGPLDLLPTRASPSHRALGSNPLGHGSTHAAWLSPPRPTSRV